MQNTKSKTQKRKTQRAKFLNAKVKNIKRNVKKRVFLSDFSSDGANKKRHKRQKKACEAKRTRTQKTRGLF